MKLNNKAITMIEIIIVLLIISILSFISYEFYKQHIDNTIHIKIKNDIKVIKEALNQYYKDNNCFPLDKLDSSDKINLLNDDHIVFRLLSSYLKQELYDPWDDPYKIDEYYIYSVNKKEYKVLYNNILSTEKKIKDDIDEIVSIINSYYNEYSKYPYDNLTTEELEQAINNRNYINDFLKGFATKEFYSPYNIPYMIDSDEIYFKNNKIIYKKNYR